MIGIALNKIREYKHKEYKENAVDFDEEYIIDEEEEKNQMKKARKIMKYLNLLEEKYKQILIERFLARKSFLDVAKLMNITPTNVKVIQNRAIRKLQKLFINNSNNE